MRTTRLSATIFCLAFLGLGHVAHGASLLAPTDRALYTESAAVLSGVVRSVDGARSFVGIETTIRIEVEHGFKGSFTRGQIVEVREIGGFADGLGMVIPGSPQYSVHERVVVFLKQRPDGSWFTSRMGLGKFNFDSRAGREILHRTTPGMEVLNDDGTEHHDFSRDAADFLSRLAAAKGNADVEIDASLRIQPTAGPPPSAYVLKPNGTPMRWNVFDGGGSVGLKVFGSQPGNDGPGALSDAIGAWNGAEPTDINLFMAGAGSAPNFSAPDTERVVAFGQPALPPFGFCDLGIACTVVWVSDAQKHPHPVSGEQFYSILDADIAMLNAGTISPSAFREMVAHEVGHMLGFRHSADEAPASFDAVMHSSINGSHGANLTDWDRDAAQTVYGPGPPCQPVSIISHPANTSVPPGSTAQLGVLPGGDGPFTYQWYQGERFDTSRPVAGATEAGFTTPPLFEPTKYWVKVSNSCPSNASSNAALVSICTLPVVTTQPQSQTVATGARATLNVAHTGTPPFQYEWYEGPSGDTSRRRFESSSATFVSSPLNASTSFWVRISDACGRVDSAAAAITVGTTCEKPTIRTHPASAAILAGQRANLSVDAIGPGPLSYQWYEGASGDASKPMPGATNTTFQTPILVSTRSYWVKVSNACGPVNSTTAIITVTCVSPEAPTLRLPPAVLSGDVYKVEVIADGSAVQHEVEESLNDDFTGVSRRSFTGDSIEFMHNATTPTRYFYRVRSFGCQNKSSRFSLEGSVVVNPLPSPNDKEPDINISENRTTPITFATLIQESSSGKSALDTAFTATTDKSWLTVVPPAGTIPANGVSLTVTANPATLPVGTNTATVVVNNAAGQPISTVAVSVNVATPVTPIGKNPPPSNALIFPAVAHTTGLNGTEFQSDLRITNTSTAQIEYQLTYGASSVDGTAGGLLTTMKINAGETKALNDVLKNFFGEGAVSGENAAGVLEVRPLNFPGKISAQAALFATIGSSRLFAATPTGNFGDFMRAIPFSEFVSTAGNFRRVLSLQHLAQTDLQRTNLGLIEGSGLPAVATIRIFNSVGQKLDEFAVNLNAASHLQLNQILAARNLPLADARIEVEPTSSAGSIMAYASVLDKNSSDSMLVPAVQITGTPSSRYVLSGLRDATVGAANWRSDVRLFNPGNTPIIATLTFFQEGGGGTPSTATVTMNPSEVKVLNDAVKTLFNRTNVVGAIHVTTSAPVQIIGDVRTYKQEGNATVGDFSRAVSLEEGFTSANRAMHVLQLEESPRFQSNLGLAELSGNPATIEISGAQPDGKSEQKITVQLQPFEFKLLPAIFSTLNMGTMYNGRVAVKVTNGSGRVFAYGVVVDKRTDDRTVIEGQ